MPGPPTGDLLLGQTKALMRSETETLSEWIATYGPAIRVVGPIGLERVLFLRPEALHQTLVKDWLDYPRVCRLPWSYLQKLIYLSQPAYLRHILGLITGYGLLTVTGDDHKKMRKAINPAFAIPNLMHRKWSFVHIYLVLKICEEFPMYFEPVDGCVTNYIQSSTTKKKLSSLVSILKDEILQEKTPENGKIIRVYEWSRPRSSISDIA